MTFLATTEREQRQSLQIGGMGPSTFQIGGPAAFEGFGTATAQSVGRAAAALGGLAYETRRVSASYWAQRGIAEIFGQGERFGEAEAVAEQAIRDAIDYYRPDPATTGFAGQLTYGIGSIWIPAIGGALIGGPVGAAVAAGGSVGTGTFYDLTSEGVDTQTALGAAAIDTATTAVGVIMPASLGAGLLTKVATGAAMNVGVGMGQRYAMGEYMRSAGYGEIAARYDAMDAMAVATDLIFGGAVGMLPNGRRPPQQAVDAAMVNQQVRHAELETAPGIPANAASLNQHVRATDQATAQLLRGQDVDVEPIVRDARFIERPQSALAPEIAAMEAELRALGYGDMLDEIGGLQEAAAARGIEVEPETLPAMPERAPGPQVEARAELPPAITPEAQAVANRPAMEIPRQLVESELPNSTARTAQEVMTEADEAVNRATSDSAAYEAAVNCFLRNG